MPFPVSLAPRQPSGENRGIYVLESAEPYALTASHRDIGQQSAGLGLYFDAVLHFVILAFVLLIFCGIPPLVDSVTHSKLGNVYEVRLTSGGNATVQPFTKVCERKESSNRVLKLSHGARCNDIHTASYYSCPTFCDYNVSDAAAATASQAALNGTADASYYCAAHLPCTLSSLDASERSTCCTETLQESLAQNSHPDGLYALQIVSVFVLLVWLANFHKQQLISAAQINARSVTAGDYAAFITGLGKNNFSRQDLAQFMSHYGEVASVSYTKNTGTLLSAEQSLSRARLQLRELQLWREQNSQRRGYLGKIFRFAYLRGADPWSDEAVPRMEARVKSLERYVEQLAKQPLHNVGEAFVTFNYEVHCNNALEDQRRTWNENINDFIHCRSGPPQFNGRRLQMSAAPEASDVNWENFDIRGQERTKRNVIAMCVMAAALGLGILLQVVFEEMRHNARVKMYDAEVKAAVLGKETSDESAVALNFLTALAATVIVLINVMLTTVAKMVNKYQRFHTRTDYEASLMIKLTVVHYINSIIVPIFTTPCEGDGECLWYAPGGLIEQAFYLQCFNAFLPDVITLLDIGGRFKRHVLAPMAKTQGMMDVLMEPDEFVLSEKYAAVCKTVGLALAYGPVLPISYAIAALALVSTYWTDKFIALRRCQCPARLRNRATVSLVRIMNVLILVHIIIPGYVLYQEDESVIFAHVALLFWGLFHLLPVKRLCGIKRDEALEEGGTGDVSYQKNMGWDESEAAAANDDDDDDENMKQFSASLPRLNTLSATDYHETDAERDRERMIHCQLLRIKLENYDRGRLAMYYPPMPVAASDQTVAYIVSQYKLFKRAVSGNPGYLQGQKLHTGGEQGVAKPDLQRRNSNHVAPPMVMTYGHQMSQPQHIQSHPIQGYQNVPQQFQMQSVYPAQHGGYAPQHYGYPAANQQYGYGDSPPPHARPQEYHDDGWGHEQPGTQDAYHRAGYQ